MITMRDVMRAIDREVGRVTSRLQNVVIRAVVTAVNDSTGMQGLSVKISDDDEPDDIEHFQPGGLSHNAGAGAEGLFLAPGGKSSGGVVICVSKRGVRVKINTVGATVLYSTNNADVFVRPDGTGALLVGDEPAQPFVLGTALNAWLAAHTHQTAMGPSGTPINAATLGTILSSKHKLDE